MFRAELKGKFQQIFPVQKLTYDRPGELPEQECIFIEIESSRNTIKDGRAVARVSGNAYMIGREEKMPFGFFSKSIKAASNDLTKDLFFFDIESNTLNYRDLVRRGFSFIYFFSGQYDPAIGTITSVDINDEE